jgi:hypothetical protein
MDVHQNARLTLCLSRVACGAAPDGPPEAEVAREPGISVSTAASWQRRFRGLAGARPGGVATQIEVDAARRAMRVFSPAAEAR